MAPTPGQRQQALNLLRLLLVQRHVDPQAAFSVFGQEGIGGGIGDGGHAFGPGQENDAGGVLTGRFPGLSPEQLNAWAWSRPGLTDLANRVARVSAGEHGGQAINSIVTRFERPANIPHELAAALAAYGHGVSVPTGPVGPIPPMSTSGSPAEGGHPGIPFALLASLIGRNNQLAGLPGLATSPAAASQAPVMQAALPPPPTLPTPPPAIARLAPLAQRFGLTSPVSFAR